METTNTVVMRGDPARIFALAADIQGWPALLPHYRYVVVEESSERHRVARMGASRDGFPVKWRCRQELVPEERRIRFTHIGGITKGMDVEWRIEPGPDGVRVTIWHALSYPVPVLGPLFAERIVGRLFVHNIAGKTLKCIQTLVEAEARAASL
jgi:ribosome-associated toxin RatA of RatAB toxin-antitoxin module